MPNHRQGHDSLRLVSALWHRQIICTRLKAVNENGNPKKTLHRGPTNRHLRGREAFVARLTEEQDKKNKMHLPLHMERKILTLQLTGYCRDLRDGSKERLCHVFAACLAHSKCK